MAIITLPNETLNYFPYGGAFKSDLINSAPQEIDENVKFLRDYLQTLKGTLSALYGRPDSYDPTIPYNKYDIVQNGGVLYISRVDGNKGNALSDTNYWVPWYVPFVNNRPVLRNEQIIEVSSEGYNNFAVSVDPNYTDVYLNGTLKIKDKDYTIDEAGTTLTFTNDLTDGDTVRVISWNIGGILDCYTKREVSTSTLITKQDIVLCHTAGDALTDADYAYILTLPTVPVDQMQIQLMDIDNNAANRPVGVKAGNVGGKINGVEDTLILDVNGFNVTLVYSAVNNNWSVV